MQKSAKTVKLFFHETFMVYSMSFEIDALIYIFGILMYSYKYANIHAS